ncbi:acetylserotonin O-methyltransferase-like isoform X2 [Lissotriton helveticus]
MNTSDTNLSDMDIKSSSEDLQYPRLILQYRDGFIASKAMFAACELGVFDLLQESGAPLPSATIADRLRASADGMERLLCACVGLKLLDMEMNNTEALYKNTHLSAIYLTKSSPKSLHSMMMYFSHTAYKCTEYLADAVRSDDELLKFMHCMNSFWVLCGRDVITAFDLSSFSKVCDLGGGPGALAKQFLLENPNSTAIIYDLPKVVQTAKKHFISPDEHRVQFLAGDFFKDPVPAADLYIIAQILHCFDSEKSLQLLSKVYNSCKPGGAVLLVEGFLNEDKSGPLTAQFFSLIMLLRTEGKEKTQSEYTKLLKATGFRDIEVKITGKLYDAILARK